jgi:hypothetical protein
MAEAWRGVDRLDRGEAAVVVVGMMLRRLAMVIGRRGVGTVLEGWRRRRDEVGLLLVMLGLRR